MNAPQMKTSTPNRLVKYPLYTIGDLSTGIYSVTPGILLMFYMTNVLGISVGLATIAASLPKIIDLLASPVVGGLSDRAKSRMGRRRPFLLFAGVAVFPFFAGVWISPFSNSTHAAIFITLMFCMCAVVYCCFLVPYCALNSEIATGYHDGTSLNSYRAAYSMLGALLAGAAAPLIVDYYGGGKHGYMVMGLCMGFIMALSVLVTFFYSREPVRHTEVPQLSKKEIWAALKHNRPFSVLLSTYFMHVVGSGVLSAAMAYYLTYVLHREADALSQIMFLMFGASVVSIPLFVWLGKHIGKFGSFSAALALAGVSALFWMFADKNTPLVVAFIIGILLGASEGGVQVFAYAMLSDCIKFGDSRSEVEVPEAILSGVFVAGEKLGFAVGSLVAGGILSFSGLIETNTGFIEQPHSALLGITVAMALVPFGLNLLCCLAFYFYRSFDKRLEEDHRPNAQMEQATAL